jgi:hypothetical protein
VKSGLILSMRESRDHQSIGTRFGWQFPAGSLQYPPAAKRAKAS